MFSIKVLRTINKPIAEVFAALSDHANYSTFKGIDKSRLIIEGKVDKNGLGAVREVVAAGAMLREEIVKYEPPYKLAYNVIFSKPLPYDHEIGEITLTENEGKTDVEWISKGTIKIPLLGPWYFDKQIQKNGGRAFGSILKEIDSR
jgi:uncharacterized protein YndB with AHSA1/START domain